MLSIFFLKVKWFIVEHQNRIALTIGIILIAAISFGLGRLYNIRSAKEPIFIEEPVKNANYETGIMNYDSRADNSSLNLSASPTSSSSQTQTEAVVASRNGTKYHLPSCPGAKQIKPENKIEFSSTKDAEAAGYKPASNCPGLMR